MLLTLEALQAAEGDCLLLHWRDSGGKRRLALIDGGPGTIYENSLRPRLDDIVAGLDDNDFPLELELVMISHMDSDHIIGIKKLVRQIRKEVETHLPPGDRPIVMKRLWLNVFNDVLGDGLDVYYKTLTASFQASVGGAPNPVLVDKLENAFVARHGESHEDAREDAEDIALILAGHNDGRGVRDDHRFLHAAHLTSSLNSPFHDGHGHPVLITDTVNRPENIADLEVWTLGPSKAEIEKLQKEFDKYITDHGMSAEAVLAAYADRSAKNLSSIVCLIMREGKSILLTGDARGDKVLDGLRGAGLMAADDTITVDVFKVPHHGSDRNATAELFQKIIADTYVISADGKHGNPDLDTIKWIVEARGVDAEFDIILTNQVSHIDVKREADYHKHGKQWNASDDSLAAFFDTATADGYKFTLREGSPVIIDLGDEVVNW